MMTSTCDQKAAGVSPLPPADVKTGGLPESTPSGVSTSGVVVLRFSKKFRDCHEMEREITDLRRSLNLERFKLFADWTTNTLTVTYRDEIGVVEFIAPRWTKRGYEFRWCLA